MLEFKAPDTSSQRMDNDISEQEVRQIEAFFLSLNCQVYVCPGIASLYFTTLEGIANLSGWELSMKGIPAVVYNRGNPGSRRDKELQIYLAERGTGFVLWKDSLNHHSNYKSPSKKFHTLALSADPGKIAGLSFDNERAGNELLRTVNGWISDQNNDANQSMRKDKRKDIKRKSKPSKVPKTEISSPCCFEHITNVDKDMYIQKCMGMDMGQTFEEEELTRSMETDESETNRRSKDLDFPNAYPESNSTETDSGLGEPLNLTDMPCS
ncbi:uncharacterized protein LOC117104951 [Anneissia japonica]|uniref:uncharacterized protein LOC117104951 n=1 Tax=Anneissia japonica TaxID=1529436 RepID=UPI0014257FD8|nr:uncharacterized protein LOC117104951 [Anneissia japonica]XP_033101798.1 uncharacterized protein LOC117104951 [Anneissia japonica]XP_033101799.1 uncharacterized protein LOC117104951 [Anneissia japonica]XP_033101800.1 uncharacterized protein LOC117104951 [Anneissia japonica]XP_033101801.1 uncharacterized protein LOC117104951 [Anneissia japonica]